MTHSSIALAINRLTQGGGMESYTLDLVKHMTQDGHRVSVFANAFDDALPEMANIDAQVIQQKHIPKKLRPFFFSTQLQKRRTAHTPLIACNRSEYADVYICGGTHRGYLQYMGKTANWLDKLTIYRETRCYQTAQTIMAHSHLMQNELVNLYGISPDKIQVVHPPVDTLRFHNDFSRNMAIRAKYGWTENDIVFLFPSTGHARKGLDLLVDFFEQTQLPIKLVVAGSPLSRPMKNVQYIGFVREMPDLYRAVDFTIMASLYEPFGLVGVESVLSGTRVILADNMACCEVLNENAGFFFSRKLPETLAQAIDSAVLLAQKGAHKIAHPNTALTYDPSINAHMAKLYAMLFQAVSS